MIAGIVLGVIAIIFIIPVCSLITFCFVHVLIKRNKTSATPTTTETSDNSENTTTLNLVGQACIINYTIDCVPAFLSRLVAELSTDIAQIMIM